MKEQLSYFRSVPFTAYNYTLKTESALEVYVNSVEWHFILLSPKSSSYSLKFVIPLAEDPPIVTDKKHEEVLHPEMYSGVSNIGS